MPGAKQAWPKRAACWSPAMPMRSAAEQVGGAVAVIGARNPDLRQHERGTRRIFSSSSSQSPLWMLNSRVREALVASVVCTWPPVSRHSSQQSTVPDTARRAQRARARRARCRAASHLGAGEIGIEDQAGLGRDRRLVARGFSLAHTSAVRRSCQTMARWIACPVSRSQTTVVSRWLVMPMAAIPWRRGSAFSRPRGRRRWWRPDLVGVVLDPAGRENAAGIPAAPGGDGNAGRKTIAREEVVP